MHRQDVFVAVATPSKSAKYSLQLELQRRDWSVGVSTAIIDDILAKRDEHQRRVSVRVATPIKGTKQSRT